MGHLGDTAFLPGQKTHINRSRGLRLFYPEKKKQKRITTYRRSCFWHRIRYQKRQTCQKEKCMINRLWYGNSHIIMAFKHILLLWSAKDVRMGHLGDTDFLAGKKSISLHSENSAVLPLTPRTISKRQTCQKEKCMINGLWYGNFHIIMAVKHISLLWSAKGNNGSRGWYGFFARAKKIISPDLEHSAVLPLTPNTIWKRQTCQKEKCMINRLWCGNFHIIMAFKHILLLWSAKGVIMGHVGDTAFLPGQKIHITTFGALGGLAFDSAYDIKKANLSEKKNVW